MLRKREDNRDVTWSLADNGDGYVSKEYIMCALLMDLRERLDALYCPEFRAIPQILREIRSELRAARGARSRGARRRAGR